MKANIEYGIQGAFKVDILSGNKVVDSTDWFSNFITQTGLLYPTTYSFVDCFRFLSIGSNGAANSAGQGGNPITTGLTTPYNSANRYNTSAGLQAGTYIGWQGYETGDGNQESACGTILTEQGPRFFRAWSVPTGGIGVTVNEAGGQLAINELMVSPSSGENPTGCFAFSRIARSISIPNGYRGIISYQLKVNIKNTGTTAFSSGTFATGNADVSNDLDLVRSWGNLSGYYRQVYHGLQCIDRNGASYIPKYGAGMEPYLTNLSSLSFYLSPDNAEFDVNSDEGGAQDNETAAYQADGLMKRLFSIPMTLDRDVSSYSYQQLNDLFYGPADINTSFPDVDTPFNIRLGSQNLSLNTPSVSSYAVANNFSNTFHYQDFNDASVETISYATPGASGFDANRSNFTQKAVFSTRPIKVPMASTTLNGPTGRKKTITRKALFSPVSSLGYNTRFGSLVFAYNIDNAPAGQRIYYPYIDTLFYDSSGRSLMQHYRLIKDIVLTERGSGISDAYVYISPMQENAQRLNLRRTFQGPFTDGYPSGIDTTHPCYTTNWYGQPGGIIYSGNLNNTATGNISYSINGGSGWGSVYGVSADGAYHISQYDVGLAEHSLSVRTKPNPTGYIYWPSIKAGNELKLNFSGVKFYHPEIGVIADTGWFGTGKQIVQSIVFSPSNNSCVPTEAPFSFLSSVTGFESGPRDTYEYGYYLTTGKYNYKQLDNTDNGAFVTSSDPFTANGYVFKNTGASTYCCEVKTFPLPPNRLNLSIRSGVIATLTDDFNDFLISNPVQITGFFTGLFDRGYTSGIENTAITAGQPLRFGFSGFRSSTPLYISYVHKSGNYMIAHSYLSGNPQTTSFIRPTGYIVHAENIGASGYRLLPNHGTPNNVGIDTYVPQQGGYYPGLSFDNGLEMFLDISWSSPCGGASNCNEPPA